MTQPDGPNLRGVNLNLLPILHEILKQRNLTRAAEMLNLTQSAVSNALKQLREHFGDDLLVRDGRRMRRTELAESLAEPLDLAMGAVRKALAPERFVPATSRQRFRIATADYIMAILAPHIARIQADEAPGIGVQMLTARRQSGEDLRVGRIDMIIMPRRMLLSGAAENSQLRHEVSVVDLLVEKLVCIGRKDDPDLDAGLTAERYLERAHAGFFLDFDVHASLEQFHLGVTGTRQFDRMLTSSFCSLPLIVANSDCLALIPESLARIYLPIFPLRAVPAPIEMPELDIVAVWHRRRDIDEGMKWLHGALTRASSMAAGFRTG